MRRQRLPLLDIPTRAPAYEKSFVGNQSDTFRVNELTSE
jgi:hypothetical protein